MTAIVARSLMRQSSDLNKRNRRAANGLSLLFLFFLVSPISVLVAIGCYLLYSKAKYSWKVIAAGTAIYGALFTLFGGFQRTTLASYFRPVTDVWQGMKTETLTETILNNAFFWVFRDQLWVSLLLGGVIGTVWAAWRWVNRPKWDVKANERRISPVGEIKKRRNIKNIQCDVNSPQTGRTLGVDKQGNIIVQEADEAKAHTFITGGSGAGKALSIYTQIPTPEGFKLMGNLEAGDTVFDEFGNPTKVLGAYDVEEGKICYIVKLEDGAQIIADAEHLWTGRQGDKTVTITTEQIKETLNQEPFTLRGLPSPVNYRNIDIPLPAYLLGAWLKCEIDETSCNIDINEISDEDKKHVTIKKGKIVGFKKTFTKIAEKITANKTIIPTEYVFNSTAVRFDLLNGLSNNTENKPENYHCYKTLPTLPETLKQTITSIIYSLSMFPVYETNNLTGWGSRTSNTRTIASIETTTSIPVRCIKVASTSNLYLAGIEYVPTHNTTTMMIGIRDHIRRHEPVLFVDLKGAADVPQQLEEWCKRYNVPFYHWLVHDKRAGYYGPAERPAYYDPIGRGDPSRKKDLIMGSQQMDNEYYKSVVDNYLQVAFQLAEFVPETNPNTSSLETLTKLLDVNHLSDMAHTLFMRAQKTPAGNTAVATYGDHIEWWEHTNEIIDHEEQSMLKAVSSTILGLDEKERSGIRNMEQRMQTLLRSTGGQWLRKDPQGTHNIDLRKITEEGGVVLFSLDSANYEKVSASIGTLIIQDLKTFSGELRANPPKNPLNVYIDEFAAMNSDNIIGLLNKSRDAYVPITLATQTLADLAKADPNFKDQLIGVVNCFIIHRPNSEEDAIVYAGLTGKDATYRERINVERDGAIGSIGGAIGSGSIEEKDEYRVSPNDLQDLTPGQMVFIAKSPQRKLVNSVQVIREDAAAMFLKQSQTPTQEETQAEATTLATNTNIGGENEVNNDNNTETRAVLLKSAPLPVKNKWGNKKKKDDDPNISKVISTSEWDNNNQKQQTVNETPNVPNGTSEENDYASNFKVFDDGQQPNSLEAKQEKNNQNSKKKDTGSEKVDPNEIELLNKIKNSEGEYVRPRRSTPLIDPTLLSSRGKTSNKDNQPSNNTDKSEKQNIVASPPTVPTRTPKPRPQRPQSARLVRNQENGERSDNISDNTDPDYKKGVTVSLPSLERNKKNKSVESDNDSNTDIINTSEW